MDGLASDHIRLPHALFCRAMPEIANGSVVGERVTNIASFCAIARPYIEHVLGIQPSDILGERIITLPQTVLPFVSSGIALATKDPKDYSVQMDETGRMVACRPRTEALPVEAVKVFVTPTTRYLKEFHRDVPFHLAPGKKALRLATHVVIAIKIIAGPNSTRHTPSPELFAHQIAHYNLRPDGERPSLDQLIRDAWAVKYYGRDFSPVYG